jgi:hypothetical protein
MPTTAADAPAALGPKTLELEARIGRLEVLLEGLLEQQAIQHRREMAMQAELDHLWARLKMFGGGV